MAPLFGSKAQASNSSGVRHTQLSSRERLILLGVIAVVLVIAAGLSIIATSVGTPISRCERVVFSQQRYACIARLANSTSNVSLCSYLEGGYEYSCVSVIALRAQNTSYCDSLSYNSSYYAGCIVGISNSTGNLSYCSMVSEPYRSQCEYNVAEKGDFSDVGICNSIANTSLREGCLYRSNYRIALLEKNPYYCSSLPSYQNYSLVYYMVGLETHSPYNITSYLPFMNATPQQYCRYSIAIESDNKTLCGAVGGYLSLACSSAIGSVSINSSANITLQNVGEICSKAGSEEALCSGALYSYIALKSNNATLCGKRNQALLQYSCYATLAKKYNNSAYCGLIANKSISTVCYSNLTSSST